MGKQSRHLPAAAPAPGLPAAANADFSSAIDALWLPDDLCAFNDSSFIVPIRRSVLQTGSRCRIMIRIKTRASVATQIRIRTGGKSAVMTECRVSLRSASREYGFAVSGMGGLFSMRVAPKGKTRP